MGASNTPRSPGQSSLFVRTKMRATAVGSGPGLGPVVLIFFAFGFGAAGAAAGCSGRFGRTSGALSSSSPLFSSSSPSGLSGLLRFLPATSRGVTAVRLRPDVRTEHLPVVPALITKPGIQTPVASCDSS